MTDVPAVELDRVTRRLGKFTLGPLTLSIPRGAVIALIGPNEAGKTTTLELIMGIERPDAGSIKVLGMCHPQDEVTIKSKVAYVKVLWWRTIGLPVLLSSILTSAIFGTDGWKSCLDLISVQVIVIVLAALIILYASPWVTKSENSIFFEASTKSLLHHIALNRPSWISQNVAIFLIGIPPIGWRLINNTMYLVTMVTFPLAFLYFYSVLESYTWRDDIANPTFSNGVRMVLVLVAVSVAVLLYRRSEVWLWQMSIPSDWPTQVRSAREKAPATSRLSGMWLLFPIWNWVRLLVMFGAIGIVVRINDDLEIPIAIDASMLIFVAIGTVACFQERLYRGHLLIRSLPISTFRLTANLQIIPLLPLFAFFFILMIIMDFPLSKIPPIMEEIIYATAIIQLAMPLSLTWLGGVGGALTAPILIWIGSAVLSKFVPTLAYVDAFHFLNANWLLVHIIAITIGWSLMWWLISNHGGEIKKTLIKNGDIYIYRKKTQK